MTEKKSKFALFFGNRGFFPASHMKNAREDMTSVLKKLGHEILILDEGATRYGAVETVAEGDIYANFLYQNKGQFDGIILCLPNFGDETGAVAALKDANVPILVQAYPDELDKMGPASRRDAFCGKFSVMDVFHQYQVPFTALTPHTVSPTSDIFAENIKHFDIICRVVKGLSNLVVGAIGARTTAFKTVRIDELALQKHGITMETIDMSDVFARIKSLKDTDPAVKDKAALLKEYTSWEGVPEDKISTLVRLGVAFDNIKDEYKMDAMAIRCWLEMQKVLGVSPCVLLSEMNNRGLVAACEVDVGNAITMHALSLASGRPATCLDWNNNYADELNKCILFHCGPVPQDLMTAKGQITDHSILANAVGEGCGYGCNVGRIAATPFSYGSMLTEDGVLKFYLGEGRFTEDKIPNDFFGCAGVAEIENLQDILQTIGYMGHRHHVSITPGTISDPVSEAMVDYLGYEVAVL